MKVFPVLNAPLVMERPLRYAVLNERHEVVALVAGQGNADIVAGLVAEWFWIEVEVKDG